jgi:hypothetical protein
MLVCVVLRTAFVTERVDHDVLHCDASLSAALHLPCAAHVHILPHTTTAHCTHCTQVALLTLFFVTVLALNLVKGGGGISSPLGIECGSASFWTLTVATFAWVIAVSYITQRHLVARYHKKNEVSLAAHGASLLLVLLLLCCML